MSVAHRFHYPRLHSLALSRRLLLPWLHHLCLKLPNLHITKHVVSNASVAYFAVSKPRNYIPIEACKVVSCIWLLVSYAKFTLQTSSHNIPI